jgi:Tfp pilus assembly protein PilP
VTRVASITGVFFLLVAMVVAPAFAQGAPAPAPAAPEAPAAKPSPLEPQGFAYEPEGRRDPFVSLVRRGEESAGVPPGARPPGLAGLATSELALRGTIQGQDRKWIAILQGVDKKSYLAKPGDKLLDGTVRTVTADSMVILQQVNDPLTLETQREVRKVLRQTEEAR